MDYKPLIITAGTRDGTLFGQYCSDGPALEQLMDKLRSEFANKPPLGGAYTPKKGVCFTLPSQAVRSSRDSEVNVGCTFVCFYVYNDVFLSW